MSAILERRRFSVAEFARLAEVGVFGPDERLELVEGEVLEMSPIGQRHAACVNLLTQAFATRCQGTAIVAVQNPLRVGERSEFYPDLALLRPRADYYRTGLPTGPDTLLVVEVSDTTVAYDREVKVPLYGRAGVPECWLVDLAGGRVEVFSQPSSGGYGLKRTLLPGEDVRFGLLPEVSLPVAELVA
jgi:Uma2 family endonuclease